MLPTPLTSLVGREHEAVLALTLLRRDDVRILTLTGPGGVGKTRLAIDVAHRVGDSVSTRVHLVPLAPVQSADLVGATVARALGVSTIRDASLMRTLVNVLQRADVLLVLDNFEHVLAAAPFVAELLAGCPRLKILATSRTLLRISGEQALPIPPLDLPDSRPGQSVAALSESTAVQLFVSRAQAAVPAFELTRDTAPLVADICRHLDGLPLAIELAAAQSSVLPPVPLLARIRARLPLPFSGPRDAPVRLRTVRDTVAWSYDLLSTEQQRLFRSIGVFVGGFGLDALRHMDRVLGSEQRANDPASGLPDDPASGLPEDPASGLPEDPASTQRHEPSAWTFDALAILVDKSLLVQESWEPAARFSMLETFRGFALERLVETGEDDMVRSAHADWCRTLAEGSNLAALRPGGQQELRRLEVEHANLRAALDWLDRRGDHHRLLELTASLGRFWYAHGHFEEGRRRLERALDATAGADPLVRAEALVVLDMLRYLQGEPAPDDGLLGESISIIREHGVPVDLASALTWQGWSAIHRGDYDRAELVLTEALRVATIVAEPLIALSATAIVLANLGVVAHQQGDLRTARARYEEALRIRRAQGNVIGIVHSLSDLGRVAVDQHDYAEAIACFRECLTLVGDKGFPIVVGDALVGSALVAAAWGQAERAARLLGAAEAIREQVQVGVDLPSELAMHERSRATVRAAIGEQGLQTGRLAGRDLSLAAVVTEVQAVTPPTVTPDFAGSSTIRLSPREGDVLRLLIDGQSDRQIAEALFISPRTAEGHVARLLAKLGVPTRALAVRAAVTAGLVTPHAAGSPSRD